MDAKVAACDRIIKAQKNHIDELHLEKERLAGENQNLTNELYKARLICKHCKEVIDTAVDGTLQIPKDKNDLCYAVAVNDMRNSITAATFREHILTTHPTVDEDRDPPQHTLMVEASMWKQSGNSRKKLSPIIHEIITSSLGDNNVEETYRNTKVDPVLRLYPDAQFMCTVNDDLSKGRGNGTLCRFVSVKLKNGTRMSWKNWDGRKVNTVSADQVEWIQFRHWPKPPVNVSPFFKLRAKNFKTVVKRLPIPGTVNVTVDVGNVHMSQFPVNANIATTGHKLQGMSKKMVVVAEWGTFSNWAYVVLSRVTTQLGLFLLKKFNTRNLAQLEVPHDLRQFEARMKQLEEAFISQLEVLEH